MKRAFFDRQRVIDSIDRATRRAMSKSLAFVRTNARRNQLRRRKRVSTPGSPPSVHSRDNYATLRNVLFAYDERTKSGIVGPVLLNSSRARARGGKPVPGMLETGGEIVTTKDRFYLQTGVSGRDATGRFTKGLKKWKKVPRGQRIRYRPRPFMGPALESEASKGNIASPWANVVS
jgi:hypothetical protein